MKAEYSKTAQLITTVLGHAPERRADDSLYVEYPPKEARKLDTPYLSAKFALEEEGSRALVTLYGFKEDEVGRCMLELTMAHMQTRTKRKPYRIVAQAFGAWSDVALKLQRVLSTLKKPLAVEAGQPQRYKPVQPTNKDENNNALHLTVGSIVAFDVKLEMLEGKAYGVVQSIDERRARINVLEFHSTNSNQLKELNWNLPIARLQAPPRNIMNKLMSLANLKTKNEPKVVRMFQPGDVVVSNQKGAVGVYRITKVDGSVFEAEPEHGGKKVTLSPHSMVLMTADASW